MKFSFLIFDVLKFIFGHLCFWFYFCDYFQYFI